MNEKKRGEPDREVEPGGGPAMPPAGPHAAAELTDAEATPGTGSLPDDENGGDEAGGTG